MNREKFIKRLKSEIDMNYQSGELPTDVSWSAQHGVLLSNAEAEFLLKALSQALKEQEEKCKQAVLKELDEIWEAFDAEGMHGSQNYILGRINRLKTMNLEP